MFSVKIDEKDLAEAKMMLMGVKNGVPRVMYRALNKTLDGVRTDSKKLIADELNLTQAYIETKIKLYKAGIDDLQAQVDFRDRPLGLIHFGAKQVGAGVSVHVKKKSGRKIIPKAFITTIHGTENVFWRRWHDKNKKPDRSGSGRNMMINLYGYKIMMAEGINVFAHMPRIFRFPIKRLLTTNVADIMDNNETMEAVLAKADIRLDKNFDHELDYLIKSL